MGQLAQNCTFEQIAKHIFLTEMGYAMKSITPKACFLGKNDNKSLYLIFNGHDKKNILNFSELKKITQGKNKIVYADKCTISKEKLKQKNITFKQIPYEVGLF